MSFVKLFYRLVFALQIFSRRFPLRGALELITCTAYASLLERGILRACAITHDTARAIMRAYPEIAPRKRGKAPGRARDPVLRKRDAIERIRVGAERVETVNRKVNRSAERRPNRGAHADRRSRKIARTRYVFQGKRKKKKHAKRDPHLRASRAEKRIARAMR